MKVTERCADCKHLSFDSICKHPEPVELMFKNNNHRIKHPKLSWCVNIEIKEKESK